MINLAQDKIWRIRLAALQFFPKLSEFISQETFQQKVEPTLIAMVVDPVFMIREESAKAIIKLSQATFGEAWLRRVIEAKLNELARNERFMLRIQTIHLINQLKDVVNADFINSFFTDHLVNLAADPVPNIRFNVSKTIGGLY